MIAFRADRDTEKKLQDAARALKKTKTEILREALRLYLDGTGPAACRERKRITPATVRASIGIWNGPNGSSVNTGRKFGKFLMESKRTRRV